MSQGSMDSPQGTQTVSGRQIVALEGGVSVAMADFVQKTLRNFELCESFSI